MSGRPRRALDAALASQLADIETRMRLTRRQMALQLGIVPSTLYRSMTSHSFSRSTRERIVARLRDLGRSSPEVAVPPVDVRSRILHLLHEIEDLVKNGGA